MTRFFAFMGLVGTLMLTSNIAYSQRTPEHWLDHDIFAKKRIFVVCDSGIDDPLERILPTMDWQSFVEIDIVIVIKGPGGVEILNSDGTRDFPSSNTLTQIHQRNKCPRGIDFNLIGKDGGIKKIWSDVVWIEDLFATIDAMPMRRYEMRQKADKN